MGESTYRKHNGTGLQPSCIGKGLVGEGKVLIFRFIYFFLFDILFVLNCLTYWVQIACFGLDFTIICLDRDNTLFKFYINNSYTMNNL